MVVTDEDPNFACLQARLRSKKLGLAKVAQQHNDEAKGVRDNRRLIGGFCSSRASRHSTKLDKVTVQTSSPLYY